MRYRYFVLGKRVNDKFFTLQHQCYTALSATICLWYALIRYDVVEVRKDE